MKTHKFWPIELTTRVFRTTLVAGSIVLRYAQRDPVIVSADTRYERKQDGESEE